MAFAGAIFDCDDTLLDSMWMWRGLVPSVLAQHTTQDLGDFCERHEVVPMVPAMEDFVREFSTDATVEQLCEHMERTAEQHYREDIHPFPGAVEFVEQTVAQGLPVAVASCTEAAPLHAGLQAAGIEPLVNAVFSGTDGLGSKREPRMFETALAALGTPREHTWIFEDSAEAAATAHAAGFPVVGFVWADDPEQRAAMAAVADVVVTEGWPSLSVDQLGGWA